MLPTVQEIAAGLDAPELLSATIIDTGQNNAVLDTGDLIVRVPRHDEARRDLAREAGILAVLAPRLPLPVPMPELRAVGAHVVAVHRKLPGQPLLSLDGMDDGQKQRLANCLARFLRALHALPVELLPVEASPDPMAEWRELRDQVVAKVLPLLPADTGAFIRERFDRFVSEAMSAPRAPTAISAPATSSSTTARFRASSTSPAAARATPPTISPACPPASAMNSWCGWRGIIPASPRCRSVTFYRSTFPLLDVLFGVDHGDKAALEAGVRALTGGHAVA